MINIIKNNDNNKLPYIKYIFKFDHLSYSKTMFSLIILLK